MGCGMIEAGEYESTVPSGKIQPARVWKRKQREQKKNSFIVPTAVDSWLVPWSYFLISISPLFSIRFQNFGLTAMDTILKNNSLPLMQRAFNGIRF
jgi:hypothetical protein